MLVSRFKSPDVTAQVIALLMLLEFLGFEKVLIYFWMQRALEEGGVVVFLPVFVYVFLSLFLLLSCA